MSWSPPSVPNSDFDRNGMIFDSGKFSPLKPSLAISGSHMYSPQLKERQLQHPSPVSYSPDLPRVIDDAEFCSLPNRTPVSCSICGKVYRHKISYLKHQWEHHELWDTCLRFNVSKHQQVQMMEAAQILVDMVNTHPQPQYSPVASSKSSDTESFSQ